MLSNVVLLNLVHLQASCHSLKAYFLEILLLYEVKFIGKGNGPLFDLHRCKDMLLVPLS
jgi:hypothetical protein